jgi:peptide/nickel transport system substrate-binding protein
VHLDLIEHYASGKISRRNFIRRGTVIGLSVPVIGAVIAACGGDDNGGSSDPTTTAGGASTTAGGATTAGSTATTSAGQTGGTIRVAYQAPAGPLDPVNMFDLATYGLIAQSFEFLATLGDDGELAPGLAESWESNEDGSVWTFQLREGVKWQDGTDFTSADVAATMDRLVAAENAGIRGVLAEGGVDSSDPLVAVFNLERPNGNFPYIVSVFNAQTVITPEAYETGTTLDQSKNGTGPWKLVTFDASTGATFERNADWWGGQTPLDGQEITFFAELGTMVTAIQGGSADAIVQFSALGGDALLNDDNFEVFDLQTTTHRQIWMGCQTGQFANKAVRQALAFTFDREQMVQTLFGGRAVVGNDHVVAPFLPFFNEGAVEQRAKDVERARSLLSEAEVPDGFSAVLHAVDLQEIPQLAQLIQAGAAEAGIQLEIAVESGTTFYSQQWCPPDGDPPCSGAAELGIVDYGHRPTPDVFCNAALSTGGVWNSSQYANPDFDEAFRAYEASLTVEEQTEACGAIESILNDEVPVGLPFFYNFLSGNNKTFQGVRVSALGQMFVDKASRV